jgi:hypothetical protein
VELKLRPGIFEIWKLSCCRVRGRVVVRVTLPNGVVQDTEPDTRDITALGYTYV